VYRDPVSPRLALVPYTEAAADRSRGFVADRGDVGRRLDVAILRHLSAAGDLSRTRVQRWIDEGLVVVAGQPARRAAQRVQPGDTVVLHVVVAEQPRRRVLAPQALPLTVLLEDESFLAIDKPPGLVVHPTYKHADGTLLNALAHHARAWPTGRPSVVNRLDMLTSGVVLVAKSPEAHEALARALRAPEARKEYLALVYGRLTRPRQRFRWSLGRDPFDRRRVMVRDDGAVAVTDVERIEATRGARRGVTLVRCTLLTGRTHQVRVHLQAAGLPIVGDPVYGESGWEHLHDPALAERLRAFPRQALHAWQTRFMHPYSGRAVTVIAPPPRDLRDVLDAAGLRTPI
jgi:23S rRNA pseudouridine1911/1915/1917 synthase